MIPTTMPDNVSNLVTQAGAPPPPKFRKRHVKLSKPLPSPWQPPQSLLPRLIFRVMCFCLTFHLSLDFMWDVFKEPKGWENFHSQYLVQLNQLSTVVRLWTRLPYYHFLLNGSIARIGSYDSRSFYHHFATHETDQLRCRWTVYTIIRVISVFVVWPLVPAIYLSGGTELSEEENLQGKW